MKKIVLFVVLTVAAGGILFAQTTSTPTTTTVSGTLGFHNGSIVVRSGTTVYLTRGLDRLVGFVDGFKDGALVTIEGYVSTPRVEGQTERTFNLVKLTFNGKVYEFGTARSPNPGAARAPNPGTGRTMQMPMPMPFGGNGRNMTPPAPPAAPNMPRR